MADHCPLLPERSPEQQLTIEGFGGAGDRTRTASCSGVSRSRGDFMGSAQAKRARSKQRLLPPSYLPAIALRPSKPGHRHQTAVRTFIDANVARTCAPNTAVISIISSSPRLTLSTTSCAIAASEAHSPSQRHQSSMRMLHPEVQR